MARTTSVNFTGANQYPIANAATDLFLKEDVQSATKALDLHDHTAGLGKAFPAGSISGAMIANGAIGLNSPIIQDGAINNAKLQAKTIAQDKIGDGQIVNSLLADGAASYLKLAANAANNVNYYLAAAGNSTTSTSPSPIPGTSFSLNTIGMPVLLFVSSPIYSTVNGAQIFLQVAIDGGAYTSFVFANAKASSGTDMCCGFYVATGLGAGAHTFQLGWQTQAGATITQNAAAWTFWGGWEYRR